MLPKSGQSIENEFASTMLLFLPPVACFKGEIRYSCQINTWKHHSKYKP